MIRGGLTLPDAGTNGQRWDHVPVELLGCFDRELVSIPGAVLVAAQCYAGHEAIVDGSVRLTFEDVESAMLEAVRAMMALGVGPGTRVGLWAPTSARWIVAALGILGAGGVLVPINTRIKGEEAAYLLRRSGAAALLVAPDFLGLNLLGQLRAADPDNPTLARAVTISGAEAAAQCWSDFMAAGGAVSASRAAANIVAIRPEQLSDIMFTSGTTGHPKGVMLTHG